MNSKSEKKDDFKSAYDLVVIATGGNASTPKCRGDVPSPNDTITGIRVFFKLYNLDEHLRKATIMAVWKKSIFSFRYTGNSWKLQPGNTKILC